MWMSQKNVDLLLTQEKRIQDGLRASLVSSETRYEEAKNVEFQFWTEKINAVQVQVAFWRERCESLARDVERERTRADAAVDRLLAKEAQVGPIASEQLAKAAEAAAGPTERAKEGRTAALMRIFNGIAEDEGEVPVDEYVESNGVRVG